MLVIALVAAIGAVIAPFADVPNPAYPEARSHAERIDLVWASILDEGSDPVAAATRAGLRAHLFDVGEGTRAVITHTEPTADGLCYALRYGSGILTSAGTLSNPGIACTPQPPGVFQTVGSWGEVLPSERITPMWYVPILVVLVGIGVGAATDIPLALITKRRSR